MSLSTKSLNFLRNFISSKFEFSLLMMVCLFGATSLCASGELARAELKAQLEQRDLDTRFHMYKELLSLQLQSYRQSGRNVEPLASGIRIATTDAEQRQKYLNTFSLEEGEIFASYDALLHLAHELVVDAANSNLSYHLLSPFDAKSIHAEPLQLYFLQILELEEDLHFPVHGAEFWVREQTSTLTGILILLETEIKAMHIRGVIRNQTDLTLKHKELNFYWTTIVNLCHEFLSRLDSRWSQCNYDRMKILNLVLGQRFSFTFPDPGQTPNYIDQFLPFILKHADLELARTRFDQKNHTLAAWDLNFEWVALHIKAAKFFLSSDQEKAKVYLEKAKCLTEDTLWCYPFSFNRANWNAKQDEARQLMEECLAEIRP